ncbi:MAG: HU family DNA-binding protein [Candidatus Kuenenbacteria bacterium]
MNKAELIQVIADKVGVKKVEAEKMIATFIDTVTVSLKKGKEIVLTGFGTFSAKKRAARMGVNPQKPTVKIKIPATTVPKFKAGKTLKDALK